MTMIENIYLYASQASILIPVYAGIRNRKALTRPFQLLWSFFVLTALFEIQAEITRRLYHNNSPGLHLYTMVEFLAFSLLFYIQTQKNSLKLLIAINFLISLTIAVIDARLHGLKVPNGLSRSYTAVSMTIYALGYLHYLFNKDDTRYMWEYPMFWICFGMLVYFTGNALYFLGKIDMLHFTKQVAWIFHLMHAGLNIVAYYLYAQSFKCLMKQKAVAYPL